MKESSKVGKSPETKRLAESSADLLSAPLPEEVRKKAENRSNCFGKYVILCEVGRGSGGVVFKAWDTRLSRFVVLKFLHGGAAWDEQGPESEKIRDFLREARSAARLRHPNIVRIHDIDRLQGRYYISMDFIPGGTCAELIHGPASWKAQPTRYDEQPARFLDLIRSVAFAVQHAHSQSPPMIHRDLKPQNILLDAAGAPVVADFGLAGEARVAGNIRGTPAYMSPEQAQGEIKTVDARSDIYALGAILYEMLSGRPPFVADNIPSLLRKIATDTPEPPSRVYARAGGAAPRAHAAARDAICLKALDKDPSRRYQSAQQFAVALQSLRKSPAPGRLRWMPVAAALVLALLLVALALPSSPPVSAPGGDAALLASGFLAERNWPALRGAVAELERLQPFHPRLAELEAALREHDAAVEDRRKRWTEALAEGSPPVLAGELAQAGELEEEFRSGLERHVERALSSLFEEIRESFGGAPRADWIEAPSRLREAELRGRFEKLVEIAAATNLKPDERPLREARGLLDRAAGWHGTWSLRINVAPFAEVSIRQGGREIAPGFTPALVRDLEIGAEAPTIELYWPSRREPRIRWTRSIPDLRAGEVLAISGDLERDDLSVVRK